MRIAVGALAVLLTFGSNGSAQEVFTPEPSAEESRAQEPGAYRPAPAYWRFLTFSASKPRAELQVLIEDENGEFVWTPVCRGACTTLAVPGADYRVGGRGVPNSRVFTVVQSLNPLYVRARAGSNGARVGGAALVSAGGVALMAATLVVLFARCETCSNDFDRDVAGTTVALVLLGGGLVAGGIALIVSNRTRLDFADPRFASTPSLRLGKGFRLASDGLHF